MLNIEGYSKDYFLTKEGLLYNSNTNKYIQADANHKFSIKTTEGKTVKKTLKELYKIAFGKVFSIDNIENLIDEDGNVEEWREVEGSKGIYYISNMGRCKSYYHYEAIILEPQPNKGGYLRVDLFINGKRYTKQISHLVAAAFLPPPTLGQTQIHHLNGIKDNRACAIRWIDPISHRQLHRELNQKEE